MSKIIFNARYNSISKIVDSFIQNDQYLELISDSNSIISGPRGCGKTTLLKMLTPEAIELADKKKLKIKFPSFLGIYIPADKQWLIQHQNIGKRITDKEKYEPIILSLLNANVLVAIVNSVEQLIKGLKCDTENKLEIEFEFVKQSKYTLSIPNEFPNTLGSLKFYIYRVVNELNASINKFYYNFIKEDEICLNFLSFSDCSFIASSLHDIYYSTINKFLPNDNNVPKWALCFDELEISPDWLVKRIIRSNFRSANQNLLFKLTATPNADLFDDERYVSKAQIEHDFNIIPCWIYNPRSGKKWKSFCRRFLLEKYSIESPEELLLKHKFNDAMRYSERHLKGVSNHSDFREGSILWRVLKDLAADDVDLFTYLFDKGIDPDNPKDNALTTDSVHRKIKPLICFRYYFGNSRSRKAATLLYYGYDYFVELTDGNPRSLLRLANLYDRHFKLKEVVPLQVQANYIYKFALSSYNDFIEDPLGYSKKDFSLKSLIDSLGTAFHRMVVKDRFTADPVTSFTLNRNDPAHLKELVEYGLEIGVFQLVENISIKKIKDINDKKIRMSFRLYPYFNIPKRVYRANSIMTILKSNINQQPNLFENGSNKD